MFKCKFCKKLCAGKRGVQKNKCGWVPRFSCTECERWFVDRKGFEHFRHTSEVITSALDLRAKGMSLAKIVDHLDQHYRVLVSRQTILDWQNKFGKKLDAFSQTFKPIIGGQVHADETFIRVGKKISYYWDCIDLTTKFIVGDHLSTMRCEEECLKFLLKVKNGSVNDPVQIHTDNSYDYPRPITKVFGKKGIVHVHYPAWKKKFRNNPIERLHNTIKETTKTFRTFHNHESTQNFFQFFKTYYNFIRKHTTLQFTTPAEAAGIFLNIQRNRFQSIIEKMLFKKLKCSICS